MEREEICNTFSPNDPNLGTDSPENNDVSLGWEEKVLSSAQFPSFVEI